MTRIALPISILPLFVAAGWWPGRRVEVLLRKFGNTTIFPAAESILAQFSGLHVGGTGAGQECARSDVSLKADNSYDADVVASYLPLVGSKLFPIGSAHYDHEMLFVDETGRILGIDDPTGNLWLIGADFAAAMKTLLLGFKREKICPASN